MVRITREAFEDYIANASQNLGSSQMEIRGAQVFQVPTGQNAPTQPDRKPAPNSPNGRGGAFVLGAAVRAACSLYNASPGGFIDRYLDFSEYTNSTSVADGLMRLVCGAPPGPPAPGGTDQGQPVAPVVGFSGGQCVCDRYRVRVRILGNDRGGDVTRTESGLRGPIIAVRPLFSRGGDGEINGTRAIVIHGHPDCGGVRETEFGPGVSSGGLPGTVFITEVINQDGPDDCGDPAPAPATDPTVNPPNPLPPFSFDPGDGGQPETYEPDIAIEPGPSGPAIRFRFPDGDYYVDPGGVDIVAPTIPDTCCPPNAVPPDPETIQPDPQEGEPEPTPPGDPEPDPATEEEERAIVAVVVTASNIATPSTPIGGTDGSPVVYAPRLGSLQFRIEFGDGQTAWTGDIDIKTAQQAIPVPFPQGAVDVRVFAYGGTSFKIRRYYAAPQANLTR